MERGISTMKEIRYTYQALGGYQTHDNTKFVSNEPMKLILEPHSFSLTLSGEVLRSSSFEGCSMIVFPAGGVVFYDHNNTEIAKADDGNKSYPEARVEWKPEQLSVQFGAVEEIDNYPNCDGESDRYDYKWVNYRTVSLESATNTVTIS